MKPLLLVRLWLMVFLHYFVWGAWYVTMGTYATTKLGFAGGQVGLAYGTLAIGAMLSPLIVGVIADRFFATQRILAFLHILGAGLLYALSTLQEFGVFYLVLLSYTITYMAGHGLTNTLTLHHSKNPAKEFPLVMIMASVGWIVAGLVVSWLKLEDNPGMFYLASGAALVMGLYSLTLPHTPPKGQGSPASLGTLLGLDALKLMRDRSFATFMVCSFLICVPLSFYFSWMNVFMNEMNIANAAAKMTLGQVSDVVFLLLLPALLLRLGAKGILMLGIGAWALRFGLFALFHQNPSVLWMLFTGILLHGICYDFIFVMGRMYVDERAGEDIRGAAQGLHAIVTLGAGMFVGTWFAGLVAQVYTEGDQHDWQPIWLIPAAMGTVLFFVFALFFKDDRHVRGAAVESGT
ncbi:MAG: MFS transporter [Pirellulaceae bacterium]|jgi:nucleoside transporter|nr:MFS transporter [Pirellulaceae bacterium]